MQSRFSLAANIIAVSAVTISGIAVLLPKAIDEVGAKPLLDAVQRENTSAVLSLLSMGVDVNSKDDNGRTPLHYAAMQGSLSTVVLLLDQGADPTMRDKQQKAPFHWAVRGGHVRVAERLLNSGAEFSHQHPRDAALLHLAAGFGDPRLTRLLLDRGADVNWAWSRGHVYPLHRAVASENLETVQLLVNYGARVDLCDGSGRTPLSMARTRQNVEICDYFASAKR